MQRRFGQKIPIYFGIAGENSQHQYNCNTQVVMFAESNKRSFSSNKTGREQKDLFIKRIEDAGDLSPRETLYSRRAFCCLKIDRARIKHIRQLNSVPLSGAMFQRKRHFFSPRELMASRAGPRLSINGPAASTATAAPTNLANLSHNVF